MQPSYTLIPWEMAAAVSWGEYEAAKSKYDGRAENHGQPLRGAAGIDLSIEGKCSELALCRIVRFPWIPRVDVFKAPDCAGNIQVRSTKINHGCLIFRPNGNNPDNPNEMYCLMVGIRPTYRCAGWIWGYQVPQLGKWKSPNNREGAWFVPQWQLRPIETIQICGPDGREYVYESGQGRYLDSI